MTQEQLRMQMLAGIITESQYKEEIEELDSMGKIGKSYPAPSTPEPIKNIHRIISDVARKKIFLGESNDPEVDKNMIYFDDKDSFYSSLESEDSVYCLTRGSSTYSVLQPISQNPNVTPLKLDLRNLYNILAGVGKIIPLRGCPDYMNDEDGQYILIEPKGLQGYISRGNVGGGLQRGTDYNLGMGFIFTLLDF
jgi:hypothetical protein